YAYDPAGNRSRRVDGLLVTSYSYDAANQLRREQAGAGRTTYQYDDCGNRTEKEPPVGVKTFYRWDEQNRLTKAEVGTGPVTFTYDADGRRVRKHAPGSEPRKFLYDFAQVLQETTDAGATRRSYTSTAEQYGDLVSQYDGSASGYYHYDALGSAN